MGAIEGMQIPATTKVCRYYRTTISCKARKLLNIDESDETELVFEGRKIIVKKRGGVMLDEP